MSVGEELRVAAQNVVQSVEQGAKDATVVALVDGLEVTVTVSHSGETRIVTPAAGARDLFLRFYPEGVGSTLGKLFGAQDVEVGESRFDDRYMIKASDESLARLWLSHDVRKSIAEAHPEDASGPFLVELENEQVKISWTEPHDEERIAAAFKAAAALGNRAKVLIEELKAIADELDGTLMGGESRWWPGVTIIVDIGDVEVHIDHVIVALEHRQPALHTRFRCPTFEPQPLRAVVCRPNAEKRACQLVETSMLESNTGDRDLSFHYWVGADSTEGVRKRFDRETTKLLLEAMPMAVVLEGEEVTVYHERFLDMDDEVKLHRTLSLIDVLRGAPRVDSKRRGRRIREASSRGGEERSERGSASRAAISKSSTKASRPVNTLEEAWSRLAGSFDGEMSDDGEISADIDGTAVRIWESWSSEQGLTLHMTSEAPGSEGLQLRVSAGSLDPLSSFLGVEDVEIGDGRFDDQFIIKANDIGFAQLWLSPSVRALISNTRVAACSYGYDEFRLKDSIVHFLRRPTERSPARLENAIRATAALGARSRAIVDECQALALELGGALIGSPERWESEVGVPIIVGQGDSAVTIGQSISRTLTKHPRLITHVHLARHGSSGDRYVVSKHEHLKRSRILVGGKEAKLTELATDDGHFNFMYWAGGENREALVWRLNEQMLSRLVLAEPEALVATEHEISLWFLGFVDDLERCDRISKILDGLGEGVVITGPAGPYR